MTHHVLSMRAGQTGRLRVTVATPTGADTTLAGAVCVDGMHRPMQVSGGDLLVGAMPPGMWLYEVRCGGATVLYGHIEVSPSPLAEATGEVGWQIDADLAADVASVTVTLAEGLPGRDGMDGRDGVDGATPEIGANGNWIVGGTDTGKPSVAVIDPATSTCYDQPADWMSIIHWAALDGSLVTPGRVAMIEIPCDTDGVGSLTTEPIWMTLWEADDTGTPVYLGTSLHAVVQCAGTTSRWRFGGVSLRGGRAVRLCPVTTPSTQWDPAISLGSGGRPRGTEAGGSVMLDSGTRSSVRLAATIRTVEGVSLHGVRLTTHDEMMAYVAEYVAAHAPAVDLGNYQGPIHLRDETGNDVLRTGTSTIDSYRHLYLGHRRIDVGLGEVCTQVVISAEVIAPNYDIHAHGYYADRYYHFAGGRDANIPPGLMYTDGYMELTHDDSLRIYGVGASHVVISMTGVIVSVEAEHISMGQANAAHIELDSWSLDTYADEIMLHTATGSPYPAGSLAYNGSYVVISPA